MKLKYYLRGLGAGIFVSVLLLRFIPGNSEKLTDAEIKERAAELGMVEETDMVPLGDALKQNDLKEENTDGQVSKNQVKQKPVSENRVPPNQISRNEAPVGSASENALSRNGIPESEARMPEVGTVLDEAEDGQAGGKKTVQKESPSEDAKNGNGNSPSKPETEATDGDEYVTITISSGQSSISAANACEKAGIVEDASELDLFLCNGGYDRRLKAGDYQIKKGASLEEIAKTLTRMN